MSGLSASGVLERGDPTPTRWAIRVAMVLTYARLHVPQEVAASFYGADRPDVSRDFWRLLLLMKKVLSVPEVWKNIEGEEEETQLTEVELLKLVQLADRRALEDATEQQVYRSQDNEKRKKYYSGKKKQFILKTQFVSDG